MSWNDALDDIKAQLAQYHQQGEFLQDTHIYDSDEANEAQFPLVNTARLVITHATGGEPLGYLTKEDVSILNFSFSLTVRQDHKIDERNERENRLVGYILQKLKQFLLDFDFTTLQSLDKTPVRVEMGTPEEDESMDIMFMGRITWAITFLDEVL